MADRIPLLIDTDPGVDDALAILMAFADARHEVVGLTIAAGNVGLSHTGRMDSGTPDTRRRRERPKPSTPRWQSCASRTSTRAACCWSPWAR